MFHYKAVDDMLKDLRNTRDIHDFHNGRRRAGLVTIFASKRGQKGHACLSCKQNKGQNISIALFPALFSNNISVQLGPITATNSVFNPEEYANSLLCSRM